jgi:hypothetical protein
MQVAIDAACDRCTHDGFLTIFPCSYAALKQPRIPPATRQTHGRMLGTGK